MADFNIQPVATQIRPVQGASLGEMINTARGVQQYQQAAQANPLELKRLQAETNVATGTEQPRISTAQSQAGTAANQLNTAQLQNLQTHQANFSRESLKLLNRESLSPQDINDFLVKTIKNAGGDDKVIAQAQSEVPQQGSTAEMKAWLARHALNSLTAESQIEKLFPSTQMLATGSKFQPITMGSPFLALQQPGTPSGMATSAEVAPSQRMVDTGQKDINNNPIFNVLSPSGQVLGQTTVPTTVQPQQMPGAINQPTTPAMPVTRIPAGQSAESGKLYEGEIITARNAAVPSKIAVNNIDTILKYLPMAQTGKASEAFAGLQSILGNVAGSKPEELAAAARDIIQKNIVDLALQKNAALGGKFASSLEASLASLAQAEKNPTAIAKSLEQLRPLMQHSYNYTIGLDRAIEKSPDKQYVKPKFDSAMNEAFDMKALMLKNSFDLGGKKGLDKFTKDNNINLVEQQKLLDKLDRYKSLVNGEL